MTKAGSLGYQMQAALKTVFKPGKSRHEDKKHERLYIRGIQTMQTMCADVHIFADFVRQRWPSVRTLAQITPEMAQTYIADLVRRERAGGYIGRIAATLRKLDAACRFADIFEQDAPPLLPYTGEGGTSGFHSDARPLAYTAEDAEAIIAYIQARDPQSAAVLRAMLVAGLRVTEAVYLRAKDIDPHTGQVTLAENANHTKGGRPRVVQVSEEDRPWLEVLRQRGEGNVTGHLFDGRGSLADRVRRRVQEACQALHLTCLGTHGFRKSFAVSDYQRELELGLEDQQALLHTSRQLGHNRTNVTGRSYVSLEIRRKSTKDE